MDRFGPTKHIPAQLKVIFGQTVVELVQNRKTFHDFSDLRLQRIDQSRNSGDVITQFSQYLRTLKCTLAYRTIA